MKIRNKPRKELWMGANSFLCTRSSSQSPNSKSSDNAIVFLKCIHTFSSHPLLFTRPQTPWDLIQFRNMFLHPPCFKAIVFKVIAVPDVIYIPEKFLFYILFQRIIDLGENWQIKNNISAPRCRGKEGVTKANEPVFVRESWESDLTEFWLGIVIGELWAVIPTKSLSGGCSLLNRFTSELWSWRGGDIVLSETGQEQNKIIPTILQLICLDTPIVSSFLHDLFSLRSTFEVFSLDKW